MTDDDIKAARACLKTAHLQQRPSRMEADLASHCAGLLLALATARADLRDMRNDLATALEAARGEDQMRREAEAEAAKLRAVVDAARGLLHDSQRGQHPPGFKGMKAGPPRLPPSLASLVRRWLAEPIAALDAAGEVE